MKEKKREEREKKREEIKKNDEFLSDEELDEMLEKRINRKKLTSEEREIKNEKLKKLLIDISEGRNKRYFQKKEGKK